VVLTSRGTPPPATARTAPDQPRRKLRGGRPDATFQLAGAAVAAVSGASVLHLLAALSGLVGFVVVAYLLFVVIYAVLVSLSDRGPVVRDAVMNVLITSCAVLAFGALAIVVFFTLYRGWAALRHLNFYSQDMSKAGPLSPLTTGGMGAALLGTVLEVGIATLITVPVGLVAAIYLDMTRSRPSRFFRTVVEAMTALPSILAGLFIFASWILVFGFGRSGFAAALALGVMMLPYVIRAADLALRLVPNSLREAASALGVPTWRQELQVVVPTARSGMATAVILGVARAIGEASPVLLVAGFTSYINANPLSGPMVSLPLETLELVRAGIPNYTSRAFGCASFLLLVVIVLFAVARRIGGWGPGHLSPRGQRRVAQASAADVDRFAQRDRRPLRSPARPVGDRAAANPAGQDHPGTGHPTPDTPT
jgi:phosphate transport system permease protein